MKLFFACASSQEANEETAETNNAKTEAVPAEDGEANETRSGDVKQQQHQQPGDKKSKSFYHQLRKALRFGRRISISKPISIAYNSMTATTSSSGAPGEESQEPNDVNANHTTESKSITASQDQIGGVKTTSTTEEQSEERDLNNENLHYGWFWGNISRRDAEHLLHGKEDGSFLVRESSDKRFLYSLTFRSNGKTMHTRIAFVENGFSFYTADGKAQPEAFKLLCELINEAMNHTNREGVFFYTRTPQANQASLHTVNLNQPLSRFKYLLDYQYASDKQCQSLQYLCKFIIHHSPLARERLQAFSHRLPQDVSKFLADPYFFPPFISRHL